MPEAARNFKAACDINPYDEALKDELDAVKAKQLAQEEKGLALSKAGSLVMLANQQMRKAKAKFEQAIANFIRAEETLKGFCGADVEKLLISAGKGIEQAKRLEQEASVNPEEPELQNLEVAQISAQLLEAGAAETEAQEPADKQEAATIMKAWILREFIRIILIFPSMNRR